MILPGGLLDTMRTDRRHHRVSLEILKDDQATFAVVKKAFSNLEPEFMLYIKREEKVVYQYMFNTESLKSMALEGQEKLRIIEDLFSELKKFPIVNKDIWRAKARIIAELVDHHSKEEDDFTFPALQKRLNSETDKRLQIKYKKILK